MHNPGSSTLGRSCVILFLTVISAACGEEGPVQPNHSAAIARVAPSRIVEADPAIVALRRASARYHNLQLALDDGFVFLHACDGEPGEGSVGTVYVNVDRLVDGVIDADRPDALVYRPTETGRLALAAAEFAVPDTGQQAPEFLGATFQREEEFGVFALHVWIWLDNPDGLFAEFNPRMSCGGA